MAEATQAQIRAEQLLEALWTDAGIGEKVRRTAKEKFPDAKILDDAVEPFVAPLRAQNEALAAKLTKIEEERATERTEREQNSAKKSLEDALTSARQSYNLTDEGFDKMVARMKETGNYSDADAAAAWVASKTPPAIKGPTWAPQDLNLFGTKNAEESFAQLHRDPVGYQDAQLAEFFKNPDQFVAETLGQ
jgi:hypothetical protein